MARRAVFRSGGTAPETRKSLTGRVAAPSATASRPSWAGTIETALQGIRNACRDATYRIDAKTKSSNI